MKENVVVTMMGGLGNQMFQYLIGLALEKYYNKRVSFDLSFFTENPSDKNALDIFGLTLNVADINNYKVLKPKASFFKYFYHQYIQRNSILFKRAEPGYHVYDEAVFNIDRPTYLFGYWQCWQYVQMHEQYLPDLFCFPQAYRETHKELLAKMKASNSVAVHIRRGDYVNNPEFSRVFHVLEADYYQKAIKLMAEDNEDIKLYYFSNDPDWVSQNLIPEFPGVLVRGNSAGEDMYLMSQAKHNIAANSSFSWWSAYLNQNLDKKIIVPKHRYKLPEISEKDMYPNDWITL